MLSTARIRPRYIVLAISLAVVIGVGSGGAIAAALALAGDSGRSAPEGVISYANTSGQYNVLGDGTPVVGRPIAEPRLVGSTMPFARAQLSPTGLAATYLRFDGEEVWMIYADTAGEHRLALLRGEGDPELVEGPKTQAQSEHGIPLVASWSPDGALFAFGSATNAPFTLNISSGPNDLQRYEVGNDFVGEAAWSPDGSKLAISSYAIDRSRHTVYIWDRAASELTRLIDGCHIIWSPDGNYLVLHRDPYDQPGVSVVSIDGEFVNSLSSDPAAFPRDWVAE
jgi:hypothetical protein